MTNAKPTICLNMIVKNESRVITRCLDSVKDIIDYWVISDTGSTDGTQQIIQNYFAQHQIPGLLLENQWENFAHNRNIALEHALGTADYILIMDADDRLLHDTDFRFTNLSADSYMLKMHLGGITYYVTKLIKGDLPWYWEGVLHEYLDCSQPFDSDTHPDTCQIQAATDGARSQNPNKYLDDARVLEQALESEPNNTRYQFYLAQSYRDADLPEKALPEYQKRITMGGWAEEVYYAMLEVAHHKHQLGHALPEVLEAYLAAHYYRPQRLEALYYAVRCCRIAEHFYLGYQLGWQARGTPQPDDVLFVENDIYAWRFADELSICAVYASKAAEAVEMMTTLLESTHLPAAHRERLENNLSFARSRLAHS